MSKRKETIEIENKLHYMCKKRRIYGCEEVTIGFYNSGKGDEIVDYCTMDSKGIIKCYEIKVTLADLKSKAKKSWYGHYNYLVVTPELLHKIWNDLDEYIPNYVGVAIPCPSSWSDGIEIRRNAKKQSISAEQELMMKESMIRSMSYKIQKFRKAADLSEISKLQSEIRKLDKENDNYRKQINDNFYTVTKIEHGLRLYYGKDITLEEIAKFLDDWNVILPEQISLQITDSGRKHNNKALERKENHKNEE